jgi:hypothetical protein
MVANFGSNAMGCGGAVDDAAIFVACVPFLIVIGVLDNKEQSCNCKQRPKTRDPKQKTEWWPKWGRLSVKFESSCCHQRRVVQTGSDACEVAKGKAKDPFCLHKHISIYNVTWPLRKMPNTGTGSATHATVLLSCHMVACAHQHKSNVRVATEL